LGHLYFSTNPQRSSQQQALLFSIFKKNLVMLVDVVKIGAVPLVPAAAAEIPQRLAFPQAFSGSRTLYLARKRVQYAYGVIHRRTYDRNGNRTRGKPIHGIQRNQVSAAQ
jgi:hypothetical protein